MVPFWAIYFLVLQPEKNIFNGKLFVNFNFLPNIDAIWVLISSQEPNDVRFLAVYTSSVRQAIALSTFSTTGIRAGHYWRLGYLVCQWIALFCPTRVGLVEVLFTTWGIQSLSSSEETRTSNHLQMFEKTKELLSFF